MSLSGREAYKAELTELACENDKILCIEADLGGKNHAFQQRHPDRFLNLGIAESAGIDMAAGLAEGGFIPFFSTFASFAALAVRRKHQVGHGLHGEKYKNCSRIRWSVRRLVWNNTSLFGGHRGPAIVPKYSDCLPSRRGRNQKVIREAAASPEPYYIRLSRNEVFHSLDRAPEKSCREMIYQQKEDVNIPICV